jgi:hypothetical protein
VVAHARLSVLIPLFFLASMAALLVLSLVTHQIDAGVIVLGVVTVGLGFAASAQSFRLELTDGYLSLRYVHRRRVIRLNTIHSIGYSHAMETTPKFLIRCADGKTIEIEDNGSTRRLMRLMMDLRPEIFSDAELGTEGV